MLARKISMLVLVLCIGLIITPLNQYNYASTQNISNYIEDNNNLQLNDKIIQPTLSDSIYNSMILLPNVNYRGQTDLVKLSKSIEKYSIQYDIDPYILVSIAYVESKINKFAASSYGALCIGIFQINVGVHKLDQNLKYDEDYQTNKACEILSYYLKIHSKNIKLALNGYNGNPSYNNSYSSKIFKIYDQIKLKE